MDATSLPARAGGVTMSAAARVVDAAHAEAFRTSGLSPREVIEMERGGGTFTEAHRVWSSGVSGRLEAGGGPRCEPAGEELRGRDRRRRPRARYGREERTPTRRGEGPCWPSTSGARGDKASLTGRKRYLPTPRLPENVNGPPCDGGALGRRSARPSARDDPPARPQTPAPSARRRRPTDLIAGRYMELKESAARTVRGGCVAPAGEGPADQEGPLPDVGVRPDNTEVPDDLGAGGEGQVAGGGERLGEERRVTLPEGRTADLSKREGERVSP